MLGVLAVLLVVLVGAVLALAIVVAVFSPGATQGCEALDAEGEPIGPTIGSLGGVSGSGVTSAELNNVRSSPLAGSTVTTGVFRSTAYGPPWGGLQGPGVSTAGGLAIAGGAPARYVIATDPGVIALGQWVYAWPNPFGWRGPFLAADTGGQIKGRSIDFYDWRGREYQTRWNRQTTITRDPPAADPRPSDASDPAPMQTPTASGDAVGNIPGDGCAAVPLSSESGVRIGQIARRFLGKDARRQAFAGFDPATTQVSWCAWFSTNVWRLAGVPIEVSDFSGYQYTWGRSNGTLFKGLGVAAARADAAGRIGADVRQRPAEHKHLAARQPRRHRQSRRDVHAHRRQPGLKPRHPGGTVSLESHQPRAVDRAGLRPAPDLRHHCPRPRDVAMRALLAIGDPRCHRHGVASRC